MTVVKKKNTRRWALMAAGAIVAVLLLLALMPKPVPADFGVVTRGSLAITIDEEARTRVRDAYVVSAPIAGRLMRVSVESGDTVDAGQTVVARILPAPPSAIDARTREQAEANVEAAMAALQLAQATLTSARADQDLARTEVTRYQSLLESDAESQQVVDEAVRRKRVADAAVDEAKASIAMREADLANAKAQLITFTGGDESDANSLDEAVALTAPISGRVLRVMQESETIVTAGMPILEIGDVARDLEVIGEFLSSDAVQINPGDRVIIDGWGGAASLSGAVERIEPWGFTKYSALGVEEQRVNVIIRFTDPAAARASLGHGYRVEARVVVWEDEDALTVPSAALFRNDGGWAVFKVRGGRARLTPVEVLENNGLDAAIKDALEPGDRLVLYPGPELTSGKRVTARKTGG